MHHTVDIPVLLALGFQEIIAAVVFILYILGQLFAARGEAKEQAKPRRPRPKPVPKVPQPGAPPAAQPRDQAEQLRSEVEEFLRRAQGKPPRPRELDEPRPQPVKLSRPDVVEPLPVEPERPAQLVKSRTPGLRSEGVAEHVARHLDTKEMAAHAASLGAEVGLADEHLESRLHEKFDHQVGRLKHREVAKEDRPTQDVAAEIAAMLATPQGMRQLIVANEILRRPEW